MSVSKSQLIVMITSVLARRAAAGANEQLILANCVAPNNANFKSSWVGYYGDRNDRSPSSVAQVQAPSGQTTWWEGPSVSATFSDKDVFSVSIPQRITTENAYVGTAKNDFGLFQCWRQSHLNAFTATGGAVCSGIYVCNHDPVPSSGLGIQLTFGSNTVPFQGDVNPWDIFHSVWDQREATQCNTHSVTITGASISDVCKISYDCYGAADWTITNGMAYALAGVVGKAVKTLETYTTKDCVDINDITRKCDDYEYTKHTISHIISHGRVDVTNESPVGSGIPNSAAGWLTYDITCPSSSKSCTGCQAAEDVLGLGAAATGAAQPEIAVGFGVANIFATVVCQLEGC